MIYIYICIYRCMGRDIEKRDGEKRQEREETGEREREREKKKKEKRQEREGETEKKREREREISNILPIFRAQHQSGMR